MKAKLANPFHNKRDLLPLIVYIILACIIMALIDGVLSPNYFVKSAVKILIFLILPISLARISKSYSFLELFCIDRRGIWIPVLLGAGVYLFIVAAYFILGPYFDFSQVTVSLGETYGVKKQNFVIVALYISFVNSLLEEFFFRGIAFLTIKKYMSGRFAYYFSAGTFSLYHVAIMSDWFSPLLFFLLIVGLFIGGLIFNRLDENKRNIYPSWLVHMGANFATNTIGFILFNII